MVGHYMIFLSHVHIHLTLLIYIYIYRQDYDFNTFDYEFSAAIWSCLILSYRNHLRYWNLVKTVNVAYNTPTLWKIWQLQKVYSLASNKGLIAYIGNALQSPKIIDLTTRTNEGSLLDKSWQQLSLKSRSIRDFLRDFQSNDAHQCVLAELLVIAE